MTSPFFSPITIGEWALPNRIVMAPMTRSRSDDAGRVPAFAADYYAQRADAGLVISEATNISPQAVGYALTPGIWSDDQVEAWKPVVAAVHDRGGRILLQLWHTGRISHPDLHDGELPVAPSAIRPEGQAFTKDGMKDHVEPRALRTDEIPAIVEDYRRAAENAKAAGFDGVEIHSANNYLLEQFVRDTSNHRQDEYGGSIENRLRFPLAVVSAVVDVWGPGRVGIRLSPATTQPGGTEIDSTVMDTYTTYLDRLSELGLAYTHYIEGVTYTTHDSPDEIDFAQLRRRSPGAYIGNNELSVEDAARMLDQGEADLISFARAYIANPDLVQRIRTGAPLAEAPQEYWYGGGETGYSDWPAAPSSPDETSASTEANIAAQKSLSEHINAGDLDAAMQSFAPDAVDHDPAPGQGPGRDGFKAFFTELTAAFPDARIQPEKAFADDDNVAVAYTLTGTHQGDFKGIPATGRSIEVRGLQIGRFENGQMVERWGSSDELGIMQQLGAAVSPKSGLAKIAERLSS